MAAKKKTTKKAASKRAAKKKAATKRAKADLDVGTVIERAFKGKTIKLAVTEDGYRIGKTTHKSLTAAAKAVTGYAAVSGPRFWGTTGGDA